ncbi:MAG: hypothetical protein U0441_24035 [Polyangiaceae bacterium]
MKTGSLCARLGLAALTMLLCSCRVSPTGKLLGVSVGSQPWRVLETKHFTLKIEAIEAEAQAVAVELEAQYRLLSDLAFPMDKDPDLHTDVIVFRTEEDYRRVGPKGSDGYFTGAFGTARLGMPAFITYGGISPSSRRILLHELTHRFVHYAFPQLPVWLNEGLASYYQTAVVKDGKAELGRGVFHLAWGDDWKHGVPLSELPAVSDLFTMDAKTFYAARAVPDEAKGTDVETKAQHRQEANYASSWATVHAMLNLSPGASDRLHTWLERMAAGDSAQGAFSKAFAGVKLADLDVLRQSAAQSWANGDVTLLKTDYEIQRDVAPPSREMSEAEVDVFWGDVMFEGGREEDYPEMKRRATAAIAADPSMVEGYLLAANYHHLKFDDHAVLEDLRSATRVAPDSEDAATALFSEVTYSPDPETRREADALLKKWLPRAASARMLNNMAWYLVTHNRAAEAILPAKKSAKADPSCHECFDTGALAYFRTGEIQTAVELEEFAANLGGERRVGKVYMERLDLFRAANNALIEWKKQPAAGPDAELPKDVVRTFAAAQKAGFDVCRHIAKESSRSGVVVVRATIGKDGKVTDGEALAPEEWDGLESKPTDRPVTDVGVTSCVLEQLQSTRFPENAAPTKFTYAYTIDLNKRR